MFTTTGCLHVMRMVNRSYDPLSTLPPAVKQAAATSVWSRESGPVAYIDPNNAMSKVGSRAQENHNARKKGRTPGSADVLLPA